MENKNIKKFKELDHDWFSTYVNWTYIWKIGSSGYCLDWNTDTNIYEFFKDCTLQGKFKNIYDALDNIVINNMTLKQLLLETDFNFDEID